MPLFDKPRLKCTPRKGQLVKTGITDLKGKETPATGKKKPRPHFSRSQNFVTVIASQEKFVIHKELIGYYSTFFDTAFSSAFIEGTTQEMELPHLSSVIFGLFTHWLYTQTICHSEDEPCSVTALEMAELWLLGEQWLISELQDDSLRQFRLDFPSATEQEIKEIVKRAFESKTETTLQKVIVQSLDTMSIDREEEVLAWLDWFPKKLSDELLRAIICSR